jgi:hypothetical protein
MSSVEVFRTGNLIHAVYDGAMNMELVQSGEQQIETLLRTTPEPVILYDTLKMAPPPIELAIEMKKFDSRIRHLVRRSATVVPDAMTAFMAKVAFALSRDHKVFYGDLDAALRWLSEAVSGSESRAATR